MRTRMLLSSMAATTLLAIAPAAFAADWQVSEDATFYIDATVTHTATPDMVNMAIDCQVPEPMSREAIRAEMREYMEDLAKAAGTTAKVRRNGAPSLYVYSSYDPVTGEAIKASEATYSGNFGYAIQLKDASGAEELATAVETMGCTYTWDPRLIYTGKYVRENRKELMDQINEKKAFYEEILGIKLTQVSNVSFSTYADSMAGGYYGGTGSAYDPETNTMTATTTLSVTFDLPKTGKKD